MPDEAVEAESADALYDGDEEEIINDTGEMFYSGGSGGGRNRGRTYHKEPDGADV